jgi:hypothetical protein
VWFAEKQLIPARSFEMSNSMDPVDWKAHVYRVGSNFGTYDQPPSSDLIPKLRQQIEPWLTAVFQAEHLGLLLGSGFTLGIGGAAKTSVANMAKVKFNCELEDAVSTRAEAVAKKCGRGEANIEDQLRAAIELHQGLRVMGDKRAEKWSEALNRALTDFLRSVLQTERELKDAFSGEAEAGLNAKNLLTSFLLSFASRVPSRERLHVFTTNYERLIEYGCDLIGLRIIDRFVGQLRPIFRASRIDIDVHYNPPGIRGEPRYLEGVLKLTKLHGSIDWRFDSDFLTREPVSFGANVTHPELPEFPFETVMVYPNPAKDLETSEYPYAELFRDFSASLCRPNSVLVCYGYGFGDDHINRVIKDMLTIPSTHLVIISYSDSNGRLAAFASHVGRSAQISLMVGNHFGDISTLVAHYLPKPAIDLISFRRAELLKNRGQQTPTEDRPEPVEGIDQAGAENEEKHEHGS